MFSAPLPVRREPRTRRSPLLSALVATTLACHSAAQLTSEGFTPSSQPLPAATSLACTMPTGEVRFDGTTVTLVAPGQPTQTLLQFASFVFGSFLLPTDPNHVLFGCTGQQHTVWLLPLQGPPPTQPLATLPYNYDAANYDATHALVSARTGGFAAPDNELWLLNLQNGRVQLVAKVPGASGPVALHANGDVFYATGFAGFPVPPGQAKVLRFQRSRCDAAIATRRVLGLHHANLVAAGLDSLGDMEFDDDGDLVFVDWFNSRVAELDDAASGNATSASSLVDYSLAPVFPTTLQFVAGTSGPTFEAFQVANGSLSVFETDYVTTAGLRTLRSRPATLTTVPAATIPAGPFVFDVAGGASGGLGMLALAFAPATSTFPLQLAGFEAQLSWSLALANPVWLPILFDASGHATLAASNPGFSPAAPATAQVGFVSTAGLLGATPPLTVMIGP